LSNESLDLARKIRAHSLLMAHRSGSSHVGSALSMADIVAVLYADILLFDAENPSLESRDRFILSKGHACMAVYAALAETGFFPISELGTYGQSGSELMAHVSHKVPGVEFSTGSLGHGLPFAAGKALWAKIGSGTWRVFVIVGDGELDEGSNWEAVMFSSHFELSQLVVIVDANNLQSLTTVDRTIALEPMLQKFQSFNCDVIEINGHDHDDLSVALGNNSANRQRPLIIIARTTKGKGVSFMENKVEWHYKSPDKSQLKQALWEIEQKI
jgi:transketolase